MANANEGCDIANVNVVTRLVQREYNKTIVSIFVRKRDKTSKCNNELRTMHPAINAQSKAKVFGTSEMSPAAK